MSVDPERVRSLAPSLPDAREAPHWHRLAFRTPRKIFATLDGAARDLNLMFNPDIRDFYCEQAPAAFSAVPGGWGRKGSTRCLLDVVERGDVGIRAEIGVPPCRPEGQNSTRLTAPAAAVPARRNPFQLG